MNAPTRQTQGDLFYTPRKVKWLLANLGTLETGKWPEKDAQLADSDRARGRVEFESKPPTATLLVHADLMAAIDQLPEWEQRCVWAFAATLGGGPWDEDYARWHETRCGDDCDNRAYGHAARFLGRRKGDVVAAFRVACCRIMILLGGGPDDRDVEPQIHEGYLEELVEVGWRG